MATKPQVAGLTVLDGYFAWDLQGFMAAPPFELPTSSRPGLQPPDGYRNPPALTTFSPDELLTIRDRLEPPKIPAPPEVGVRIPEGYYPYSEVGFLIFDGTPDFDFTGKFRLNIGGDPGRYDVTRNASGHYSLLADGTGILDFEGNGVVHLKCFFVMSSPDDMLLMVHWVNTAVPGFRRSTGNGRMKRMI